MSNRKRSRESDEPEPGKHLRRNLDEDMELDRLDRDPNAAKPAEMIEGDGVLADHNQELDVPEILVQRAKQAELTQLGEFETFDVVPRSDATMKHAKVIGSRWVLVNMGNRAEPRVKARLVAKDFGNATELKRCSVGRPG